MRLARYPRYKDSGVAWLGSVPSDWSIRRLGYYFVERREKVSDKDYPPLSVTKSGVVPQLDTAAKSDDTDNRKKVCAGDFVINGRSDRKGSSGMAEQDGSVSLINIVLSPAEGLDIRFAHHLLRSVPFQEEFYRFGKGIVADLWSTNYSEMRNISLAVPSLPEQTAIAAFLDRETAKIEALIAEQERLLTLLAEKRQAVISHAVTKGLNPDARMKDSGVAWLGEVPAHWEVLRVKHCILSVEQGWSPQCDGIPTETEDEWGVLKVGCVNGGVFNPAENKKLPVDLEPRPSLAIREGDVLVSRANTRELVGSSAVALRDFERLLLCDKLYRIRTNSERLLPAFLSCWLGSGPARSQIQLDASGASSSMLNIGQGAILEMLMPVPSISEQSDILSAIEKNVGQSVMAQGLVERSIALLRERRSSLIAAAVTGQIDVREAA